MTLNRMLGVDFSMPVAINEWTMVVPLSKHVNVNMIFIIFGYEIWFILLSVMIAFIVIFGLADYIFYGKVKWGHLAGFATRTAMIEAVTKPLPNDAKSYQKLFIISWTLPMFILATAYAGNMTAMMTKPTFSIPIKDAEDLVNQNQISWTLNKGTVVEPLFKSFDTGTTYRKLYDNAEAIFPHDCYTERNKPFWKSGKYAMPCTGVSITSLMSFDYSQTGLCNYIRTPDIFSKAIFALAFQVHQGLQTLLTSYHTHYQFCPFSETKPIS